MSEPGTGRAPSRPKECSCVCVGGGGGGGSFQGTIVFNTG